MELQNIGTTTTWNEAAGRINSNNQKISVEVAKLGNATYKNKGYFKNVAALTTAYPSASVGSKAYVGSNYPYTIFQWDTTTQSWETDGSTGGDEDINLANYYTKEETIEAIDESRTLISQSAYDALGTYEEKWYYCTED